MARERLVKVEGGATRSVLTQHGVSGKVEHFRHVREDLAPHMDRVKDLAQGGSSGEYRYEGSVPRVVIDTWLKKKGKTWHDWATDTDLKSQFLLWFKSDFKKMRADNYRERSLKINRAKGGRLGAKILNDYRKENA